MSKKRFKPRKVKAQQVRKSRQDWDRAERATGHFFDNLREVEETLKDVNQTQEESQES